MEIPDDTLTGGMNREVEFSNPFEKAGGMPCPTCGQRLEITLAVLLGGLPVRCRKCKSVLTVNRTESAETLGILKKFVEKTREIQARAQETED